MCFVWNSHNKQQWSAGTDNEIALFIVTGEERTFLNIIHLEWQKKKCTMKLRHDKFLPLFTNKSTHESLNRVHHRSLNGQNIAHFLWNLHKRAHVLAARSPWRLKFVRWWHSMFVDSQ